MAAAGCRSSGEGGPATAEMVGDFDSMDEVADDCLDFDFLQ